MRIAAVQHRLRETAEQDAAALVLAAESASESGAEIVFFPDVPSLFGTENPASQILFDGLSQIVGARFVPAVSPEEPGYSSIVSPPREVETLGKIALMVGDAALDREVHTMMRDVRPNATVLCPRSESELQAEAMLELAIGLSLSVSGLVVIAECSGADPGCIGHGESAIVLLGDVLAEAMAEDDVLIADVDLPIPHPEPAEALPVVPPILQQRLAHHRGVKVQVDYPADLTS
jgi:hypothetical protein